MAKGERRNIVILGGDGFCGWPTALHLSAGGHRVTIFDNLSRRAIDEELGTRSLTPIETPETRLAAWHEVTGQTIGFHQIDIAREYDRFEALLGELRPDAVVHFAEQRSAPYSMASTAGARYTISNNLSATHNLLCALNALSLDAHLIHLGSIGVYGYASAGLQLPEGYLKITAEGSDGRQITRETLFPGNPDSIYHLSKSLDQHLFAFYARQSGLRCTDLHQGIVWGVQTQQTRRDPRLVNRFDYDPVYGTVVNRFLVQATTGHALSVYGTGEQTRAFIHLSDTIDCIEKALDNPPVAGERVRIVNQTAQSLTVTGLAKLVAERTGANIAFLANPRQEPVRNDFAVDQTTLAGFGIKVRTLEEGLTAEIAAVAELTGLKDEVDAACLYPVS
ncbi:MAG: NAD-dependent epimerase/dehydratase family protein [Alphaproteobacteria bacterium]|nr:NAD-dependent epimerase/dehydratase family protein [Alphaproteobacteria bacterium]